MATANIVNTKIVFPETTVSPYYDDFKEEKNFSKLLFRPGHAVQARELTQIQTILQNQIERFGNHIFKNGSIVHGGQISSYSVATLNLEPKYVTTEIVASQFLNDKIRFPSGNNDIEGIVIGTREAADVGVPILSVVYSAGAGFANGTTIKAVSSGTLANISSNSTTFSSRGVATTVSEGIFFINGYFVRVPSQTIIVDPFTPYANAKVGLEFNHSIITENSDDSLLDPAQESSNYQAPGAARLKIDLNLKARTLDTADEESFIELLRIENGVVKKKVINAIYSQIGEEMARRTYDESGNYTVNRFDITFEDHPTDANLFNVVISPGKAYILGYEKETIAQEKIELKRARDIATKTNYDMAINYGNILTVSNTKGVLDYTGLPSIDLHVVDGGNVNTTSAGYYRSTLAGVAKIRNIEYNSGTGSARDYNLSLFDFKFFGLNSNGSFTSTTTDITGTNLAINDGEGKFALSKANTYRGAVLRVVNGTGIGSKYNVLQSNYGSPVAANLNLTLDRSVDAMDATSNLILEFDFSDVKSLIDRGNYGNPANWSANISSKNIDSAGLSFLRNPTVNSLLFRIPNEYIRAGSIVDQQYQYIRRIPSVSFTGGASGTIVALDPLKEAYNETGTAADNFIVIDSSGVHYDVLTYTLNSTTQELQIFLDPATPFFTGTVYAVVNLNTGNNTKPKVKVLTTANTNYLSSGTLDATLYSATTNATTKIYSSAGQVLITNFKSIPGLKHSLYTSDVKAIKAIYDTGSTIPSPGDNLNSFQNVTGSFGFDSGQNDAFYDHGSISLRPRAGSVGKNIVVCFDWYEHYQGSTDDGRGYFSVDSYPDVTTNAGYSDIPYYTSESGEIVRLRDCIDFRPKRTNFSNTEPTITNPSDEYTLIGNRIPKAYTNFQMTYDYYLDRNSLLIMTNSNKVPFTVIDGKSSLNPSFPSPPKDSMVLYKLQLNPYTATKNDIVVNFVDNKRYTMRDIGTLEKRIENVEYYASLSLLEKNTLNLKILDENGLERTKNGILVDDFTTHGIGDIYNPDYYISVDKLYGAAQPPQSASILPLEYVAKSSISESGKYLTLPFKEETFVAQPYATKYVPIMDYWYASYIGHIVMDPPDDFWVDSFTQPDVISDNNGENTPIADPRIRTIHANCNSKLVEIKLRLRNKGHGDYISLNANGIIGTSNTYFTWDEVFKEYCERHKKHHVSLTLNHGFWHHFLGSTDR